MATTVNLLVRARAEAGLTQRELSAAADVPQASVSRIERGLISPRASTVERWLAACGMTLEIEPTGVLGQTQESLQTAAEPEEGSVREAVEETVPERRAERNRLDWAPWMS